jgi:hypothetical protein
MQAVYELATVTPPVPPDARFTRESWQSFRQGYYVGVQRALLVLQLALDRWTARQRERRRRSAADRQQPSGLREGAGVDVREKVRVVVHEAGEAGAQVQIVATVKADLDARKHAILLGKTAFRDGFAPFVRRRTAVLFVRLLHIC